MDTMPDQVNTTMTAVTTWPIRRNHHTTTTQRPSLNIAPRPKPQRTNRHPPVGTGEHTTAPTAQRNPQAMPPPTQARTQL
eukprot:11505835-Prorocentrum_lima.AAC.1